MKRKEAEQAMRVRRLALQVIVGAAALCVAIAQRSGPSSGQNFESPPSLPPPLAGPTENDRLQARFLKPGNGSAPGQTTRTELKMNLREAQEVLARTDAALKKSRLADAQQDSDWKSEQAAAIAQQAQLNELAQESRWLSIQRDQLQNRLNTIQSDLNPRRAFVSSIPQKRILDCRNALDELESDRRAAVASKVLADVGTGLDPTALQRYTRLLSELAEVTPTLDSLSNRPSEKGNIPLKFQDSDKLVEKIDEIEILASEYYAVGSRLSILEHSARTLGFIDEEDAEEIKDLRRPAADGSLELALFNLTRLRDELIQQSNWSARKTMREFDIERSQAEYSALEQAISSDPQDSYVPVSFPIRLQLADQIQQAASDTSLALLAEEGRYRAEGLQGRTSPWAGTFDSIHQSLDTIAGAIDALRDQSMPRERVQSALGSALYSVGVLQATANIFDTQRNPQYAKDVASLPMDPSVLESAGARQSFDAFRTTLETDQSRPVEPWTKAQEMRLWYGSFIDQITMCFSYEHLRNMLNSAIALTESPENENIIALRRAASADAKQGEIEAIAASVGSGNTPPGAENGQSDGQAAVLSTWPAAEAGALPAISQAQLDAYSSSISSMQALDIRYVGPQGGKLKTLIDNLRECVDGLRSSSGQESVDTQGSALPALLAQAVQQQGGLLDPTVVEIPADKNSENIAAVTTFIKETSSISLEVLDGKPQYPISDQATWTPEEREADDLSQGLSQSAGERQRSVQYVSNLKRSENISPWDIFVLANTAYGFLNLPNNYQTAMGNPDPDRLFPGSNQVDLPSPTGVPLALAYGDLAVNAIGSVKEGQAAFGNPEEAAGAAYFAASADPRIFKNLNWEVTPGSLQPTPGNIYLQTPQGIMHTAVSDKKYREALAKWKPAAKSDNGENSFYVVDSSGAIYRYLLPGPSSNGGQRVEHLTKSTQSLLMANQAREGLRNQVLSAQPSILERYLAIVPLFGVFSGLTTEIDAANYRTALHSRHGGWVDSIGPQVVATVRIDDASGHPQKWIIDANGGLYFERTDTSGAFLDPVYGGDTISLRSGGIKMGLDLTRGLWARRSDRRYITSLADARAGLALYSEPYGRYFPDHWGSPPAFLLGNNELQANILGQPVAWQIGKPTSMDLSRTTALVTPIYDMDNGVSQLAPSGFILMSNDGIKTYAVGDKTAVDPTTIYHYAPSLSQRFDRLASLAVPGLWTEVDPDLQGPDLERRLGIPAQDSAWQPDLDGTLTYHDSTSSWIKWQDSKYLYLADATVPDAERLYRIEAQPDGSRLIYVKSPSLADLATASKLPGAQGEWFHESFYSDPPNLPRTMPVFGLPDGEAWLDSNGVFRLAVSNPQGATIGGVYFPLPGTWRFQYGDAAASQDTDSNLIFYRRRPLPLALDLDKMAGQPGLDIQTEVRMLTSGTVEKWYRIYSLSPGIRRRELVATYIGYTGSDGRPHTDYVDLSQAGIDYSVASSSLDIHWKLLFSLPLAAEEEDLHWTRGGVPDSLTSALGGSQATAYYAYDWDNSQFYLRLTLPSGELAYFMNETSPQSDRFVAQAIAQGIADWYPIAEGVPESLIREAVPGPQSPDQLRLFNGRWEARYATEPAISSRIRQLEGGQYADVLPASVTWPDMIAWYAFNGETAPDPMPGTVLVGGLRFHVHIVNSGNQYGSTVLEAAESGPFNLPGSNGASTGLVAGQCVLLGTGMQGESDQRLYAEAPRPHLTRVYLPNPQTASGPAMDSLPGYLGMGAASIRGEWTDVGPAHYFFADAKGGVFRDAITNRQVVVEPESVWLFDYSYATSKRYSEFEHGDSPAWALALKTWPSYLADYRSTAAERGVRDADLVSGAYKTIPGTSIVGSVMHPASYDPAAPTVLRVVHGGTLSDPVLGSVRVQPGDVVSYEYPASMTLGGSNGPPESNFTPSPFTFAEIQSWYLSRPTQTGTRTLVAGTPQASTMPGLPKSVSAVVYTDPSHPDSPLIARIVSAPKGGVDWHENGLGCPIRLTSGLILTQASNPSALAESIAKHAGADEFLQPSLWDLRSTLAFDAQQNRARGGPDRSPREFYSEYRGIPATFIEDQGDPGSTSLAPHLNYVILARDGTIDGSPVSSGVLYRRQPTQQGMRKYFEARNAWAVAYPIGPAGHETPPVALSHPVPTQTLFVDPNRPFARNGTLQLVSSGPVSVEVYRLGGTSYIVTRNPVNAAVMFYGYDGAGEWEVKGPALDVPELGGLCTVGSLSPAVRAKLKPLPNGALIQSTAGGRFNVVELKSEALAWLSKQQAGYGYIQMRAGEHELTIDGVSRKLAGWVGIGDGPDDIPFPTLTTLMQSQTTVKGTNWILADSHGNPIGTVIFGVAAAEDAFKPHTMNWDPAQNHKVAAVIPLDHHKDVYYLSAPEFQQLSPFLRTVYNDHGMLRPAYWDPESHRWLQLALVPPNSGLPNAGQWTPIGTFGAKTSAESNYQNAPYGWIDDTGKVIALIAFPSRG